MIEMVFVIVILGILAAVAIPRLAASRDDAIITKGKSQVSAIRSGISLLKSKNMLSGTLNASCNSYYPCALDNTTAPSSDNDPLFHIVDTNVSNDILEYPIYSRDNHDGSWIKTTSGYSFQLSGQKIPFTYTSGTGSFDCNSTATATGEDCKLLTR